MKRKLLLGAFILGSFFTVKAQTSCATALNLPLGTTTVEDITGAYQDNCFEPDGADAANWYTYTATENGALGINTYLDVNDGDTYSDDTRVSVYTGTCDNLICWSFSDDFNADNGEFLVDFDVQVLSGQTYYIAFDNNWSNLGFQLEVTFTPLTCFPVTGGFMYASPPTINEVIISWTAAINSPLGYDVLWGETGFDSETEGTLIQGLVDPQATFSGLTPNTTYDMYVRTICSSDDVSSWVGPTNFTTPIGPASVPYTFGFESDNVDGWSAIATDVEGSPWSIEEGDEFVAAHSGDYYVGAGAYSAPSDAWLFSRGISLSEGVSYTVSYYIMRVALEGAGNVNNIDVTIGSEATVEAQNTTLQSFDNYAEDTYVLQTYNFTVPSTGVYYIGFNYTAPAHTEDNYGVIAFDDFTVDVTAGINQELISKLSVSPNPTNGIVSVSNTENILINNITIADLNGRTVKTVNFNGTANAQVNISELATGMYMMTISSDNGIAIKKVIKN